MDETIGYNDDEEEENAATSTQWDIGTTSALSLNKEESSKSFYQHQKLQLHLLQKKETLSRRRIIPSSLHERLSYYRTFVSSATRTQITCMEHVQFNRFLWYYIINVIFKSFPHTFVQIFLSSYAPEDHLFLSKMVPFFRGTNGMFLIAGFFELIGNIDTCIVLFDYLICGFLHQNPWNRCETIRYFYNDNNKIIRCYDLNEFAKKLKNGTSTFKSFLYVDAKNESFQVAQIEYYRYRKKILWNSYICFAYFAIMWLSISIAHTLVHKKLFWKILNILQWAINFIDITIFIYIIVAYFHEQLIDTNIVQIALSDELDSLKGADIDMLSESTTAPPVIHVLTSRSTQEISPNKDSSMIITSNAIYVIFRGLLIYRVKGYIENVIGAPLYFTDLNRHSWFYLYPMYFSTFYLGDLYTLVFLSLNFMMSILTITVTYHSFIEVIVCEWLWATRHRVTIFITITGCVIFVLTTLNGRIYLCVCSKVIAALTEILILYCVYPLGRLVDDFTFHYGESPTKLRVVSLKIVPIYYTIKCYTLVNGLYEAMTESGFMRSIVSYKWLWLIMFVPIILGMIYTAYSSMYKQKKNWQLMFCPNVNWGPRDVETRQFRKQFDSRVYIGSQASRPLSRYLIDKGEPNTYQFDLCYDGNRKATAINVTNSISENKKKRI